MASIRLAKGAGIPQSQVHSVAADQATLEALLVNDSPMLIAISGKPEDRTALILTKRGNIQRAKRGDNTDAGTVLAIGDTQVQFQTNGGRVIALALP
ncbi:hypothetical protein [Pseudoruegeria sp. HB172150]|uniref:hypothetical protein n=1 Tax=Pseudoruegeria sp. HB172150 TaxID=2721164 RepID=UPI001552552E|nr:hypothetical protein [Pseudoruegeria sp. HB172150]